ncbi:MAG TPA: LamG-like jellyroll fold domain-containing protein, partial [Bacillota bacterium]|nr:LamG-like jellyroll fold domain-containing protein [Bacillota bacterium]
MKKIFRIASVTIILGIITAWAITIPAFSEMKISTVGRWNFDWSTYDSSGYGNHGGYYPSIPTFVEGVHQAAFYFSGSDYLQIPNSPSLNFGTGDYSISGWVKTTSTKTINTIIDKRTPGSSPGYHVALYNGTLLLQIGDSSGYYNFYDSNYTTVLNDGALHSFVITVDQYYTLDVKFYIDGALKKSFSISSCRGSSSNTAPLYIARHSSSTASYFVGMLDEISIYPCALIASQVAQIYLNGSCRARWALDGDATDSSCNGNSGTLSGSPLPETFNGLYYLNQAMRFNSANYITVPDRNSLDIGVGDFSLSCWVNTTDHKPCNTIIDKLDTAGYGYKVYLHYGDACLQIVSPSGQGTFYFDDRPDINDGFWHFITFTIDRDNSVKLYVDNSSDDYWNATSYQGDISNSVSLYIGRDRGDLASNFNGAIDEIKLYNKALTTQEINAQYSMGVTWRPDSYNTYFGHVHNHSNLSDGAGSATQAYSDASAHLDFFALADHSYLLDPSEWSTLKAAADAANVDGTFVALCGFEWSSSDNYGHVAVISTPANLPNLISHTDPYYDTFDELKEWLSSQNAVAFFNHPNREDDNHTEFDHFNDAPCDKFVGMELWNKAEGFNVFYDAKYTSPLEDTYKNCFNLALSRKWKIGASGSEDNHSATWGHGNYRLAVLATAKTRSAIFDALKARRFYSTLDKNLKLSFTINDAPMGATIFPGTYYASIYASDDDGETFTKFELF